MVTKASPVIKVGRCVPGRHLALWGFPRTLHSLRHGKVEKGDSGSPAIAARKRGRRSNQLSLPTGRGRGKQKKKFSSFRANDRRRKKNEEGLNDCMINRGIKMKNKLVENDRL